ncbi:Hypothetical protein HVR_LOCUS998 [uncultured virus]|nr:Hypothetical protein HVR_LOCUS998 [uncultured virus]
MTKDRLRTGINIPREDGKGCRLVPTCLGKIKRVCVLNRYLLEDTSIDFTQKTWDMIVYFQSALNDKGFDWKHNKFMKPVIAEITDEEREKCLEELTNKASLKKQSLIEEFGKLYLENRDSSDNWSFSRHGRTLIRYFDGFCEKKHDTTSTVTILGEIHQNDKTYVPPCRMGEPCGGCKEVQRLLSVYGCNHIRRALRELKSNLHQPTEISSILTISTECENALIEFQNLIPKDLTQQRLIDMKFSMRSLCLILAVKKSCTLGPFKLKRGIRAKGCQGLKCRTCPNIQARVARYSLNDISECVQELKDKLPN